MPRRGEVKLVDSAQLATTILRLRRSLSQLATRGGPDPELPLAKGEVLRLVYKYPGRRVQDVADALGIAANTASTVIGQLSQLGLIQRQRDPDDARVARLYPTAAARARRARLRDRRDALVARAIESLSASDQLAIERALGPLGRLLETLDRTDGKGHELGAGPKP
jgi:DNA-binding MarR family transcriptional regulator